MVLYGSGLAHTRLSDASSTCSVKLPLANCAFASERLIPAMSGTVWLPTVFGSGHCQCWCANDDCNASNQTFAAKSPYACPVPSPTSPFDGALELSKSMSPAAPTRFGVMPTNQTAALYLLLPLAWLVPVLPAITLELFA